MSKFTYTYPSFDHFLSKELLDDNCGKLEILGEPFVRSHTYDVMIPLSLAQKKKVQMDRMEELYHSLPSIQEQQLRSDAALVYMHYFNSYQRNIHTFVLGKNADSTEALQFRCRHEEGDQMAGLLILPTNDLACSEWKVDLDFEPRTLGAIKNEFLSPISAEEAVEALLSRFPLHTWCAESDISQALSSITLKTESEGKRVVGNVAAALFDKLQDALDAGEELTPSQMNFYEEEMSSRSRNPLYQKPKP